LTTFSRWSKKRKLGKDQAKTLRKAQNTFGYEQYSIGQISYPVKKRR